MLNPFCLSTLHGSQPTFFLSATPFSQPTTTSSSGSPKPVASPLPFLQELELRIQPSDGLLFLTRTLLPPPHHRPPSNLRCLSRTWPTGFHPKSQLLAPDLRASYAQSFRALWKTLLSTSLPFSRSLAVIPESLQRSLKVCQPPAAVGLLTSLPTTATVQLG